VLLLLLLLLLLLYLEPLVLSSLEEVKQKAKDMLPLACSLGDD